MFLLLLLYFIFIDSIRAITLESIPSSDDISVICLESRGESYFITIPYYLLSCRDFTYPEGMAPDNGYRYDSVYEQPFQNVENQPSAYFMLDRNTASYTQMRRTIENGYRVNPDSVRAEEYINYFDYDFAAPVEGEEIAVSTYLTDCPWNEEHKLMTIGVKTEEANLSVSANNYVFLIDVSGSMEGKDRLERKFFRLLIEKTWFPFFHFNSELIIHIIYELKIPKGTKLLEKIYPIFKRASKFLCLNNTEIKKGNNKLNHIKLELLPRDIDI